MTSPAFHLAVAMQPYQNKALVALARRAGVPIEHARRARMGAHGRPTSANHHLRLCMVIGIDPVNGHPVEPYEPRPLLNWFFALGVKGNRYLRRHTLRQAAAVMGISSSSLSRIEHGDIRSFDCLLAACRYMGAHPHDYVSPLNVQRETGSETKQRQGVAA